MPAVSFTAEMLAVHPRRAPFRFMTTRHSLLAVAVPALVLSLAACTPVASEPAETFVAGPTPDATPEPELTPNAIEADTTLIVRATAKTTGGASLALELQVHRSSPWDYVGTQTLPAAIIEDCGEPQTDELFAAEQWSFTRANLTAIPSAASSWPADAVVTIAPSAATDVIAGRGILAGECGADKRIGGAGRGAVSLGIAQDASAQTGWATRSWGFLAGAGVILTDCTFEVTTLGTELGGGAGWSQRADDATCVTGP